MPVMPDGKYRMNPSYGKGAEPAKAKHVAAEEEMGDKPASKGEGHHAVKTEISQHPSGKFCVNCHHSDGSVEHTEHGSMEEAHSHSMDHFENNGEGEENLGEGPEEEAEHESIY